MLKALTGSISFRGRDNFSIENFLDGVYSFDQSTTKKILEFPRYEYEDNTQTQPEVMGYHPAPAYPQPVAADPFVRRPAVTAVSASRGKATMAFQENIVLHETEKKNTILEFQNQFYLIEEEEVINLLLAYNLDCELRNMYAVSHYDHKIK